MVATERPPSEGPFSRSLVTGAFVPNVTLARHEASCERVDPGWHAGAGGLAFPGLLLGNLK